MLRAVRFAATFRFHLDIKTADAIRQFATDLNQVSVERIAQELRRMLSHSTRATAVKMLEETSLLAEVLPEITSISGLLQQDETLEALGLLESASFEAALSLLLRRLFSSGELEHRRRVARIEDVCRRLKMSNEETDCVCWLINSLPVLENIAARPLHILKPLLNHPHSQLLLDVSAALARSYGREPVDAEFCRRYLSRTSPETLAPATLIDGRDVMGLGIPAGPVVRELLAIVRNEQLDELLATREQALDRLRELYRSAR
jgi:poly(A) polymerase